MSTTNKKLMIFDFINQYRNILTFESQSCKLNQLLMNPTKSDHYGILIVNNNNLQSSLKQDEYVIYENIYIQKNPNAVVNKHIKGVYDTQIIFVYITSF